MSLVSRHWENLQARERWALALGALISIGLLFYGLLWAPLVQERGRLSERVVEQRELLSWMQTAAQQVEDLRKTNGAPAEASGGSVLARVERTARAAGLAKSIGQIQPEGAQGARVRLEAVAFDELLRWLDDLAQVGLTSQELAVERNETAGKADVSLLVQGAGR